MFSGVFYQIIYLDYIITGSTRGAHQEALSIILHCGLNCSLEKLNHRLQCMKKAKPRLQSDDEILDCSLRPQSRPQCVTLLGVLASPVSPISFDFLRNTNLMFGRRKLRKCCPGSASIIDDAKNGC